METELLWGHGYHRHERTLIDWLQVVGQQPDQRDSANMGKSAELVLHVSPFGSLETNEDRTIGCP